MMALAVIGVRMVWIASFILPITSFTGFDSILTRKRMNPSADYHAFSAQEGLDVSNRSSLSKRSRSCY